MTTISSVSSAVSYRYTKPTSDSSEQSISSSIVSGGKASAAASRVDSEASLIDSAQKLLSQLMTVLMNAQGQSSQSTQDADEDGTSPADRVAAMDSDGDGMVTQAEFVAARPDDVSEEQASSLFASFDSEDAGTLSVDALSEAMAQGPGQAPRGPPPPSDEGDDTLSSLFSTLDSDGDGVISQEEFLAARPDDVSEDQASTLFESLDTEGTGSLSEDQFVAGLKANLPPPPPPLNAYAGNDNTSTSATHMTL